MFRCFPRCGGNALRPLWRQPSLTRGGSRGIKLVTMVQDANADKGLQDSKFSHAGRQSLQELAANNIGLYSELRPARRLDWGGIHVKIAPRHTVQRFDMDCFTSFGRAYTEVVCRRYLADNDRPLWWTARLVEATRPIVRNKGSARLNVAFREALRSAGYDMQGRRKVVPTGQQVEARGSTRRGGADEPWRKEIVQLFGSVEMVAFDAKALHKYPFRDLQSQFSKVVRGLEEELGKKADGSLAAQGQARPVRGPSDRTKARGGPDRPKHSRQSDQSQQARPQNARKAEAPRGKPQITGVRRLDLGRQRAHDK